jgi:hypothetical protein
VAAVVVLASEAHQTSDEVRASAGVDLLAADMVPSADRNEAASIAAVALDQRPDGGSIPGLFRTSRLSASVSGFLEPSFRTNNYQKISDDSLTIVDSLGRFATS